MSTAACDPKFSRDHTPPNIALIGAGTFNAILSRQALKKAWPVVAVLNRAGEKIGRDWGPMTGLKENTGQIVQDFEQTDLHALQADIAVVAISDSLRSNMPTYRRLLGAGINILCLGCESYFPSAIDKQIAAEIDDLAKANGVTFTGTGTWDYSRIWPGITMAGVCMQLNSLHHSSLTNFGRDKIYPRHVGVGLTPEEFQRTIGIAGKSRVDGYAYHLNLQCVLFALGYEVTEVSETREPVLFDHPAYCAGWDKMIEPGLCAGLRKNIIVKTKQGVTGTAQIDLRIIEPGEIEYMRWAIEGNPGVDFTVERRDNTAIATGACLLNRIPDVISAPPGIQMITQLGPLKSTSLI